MLEQITSLTTTVLSPGEYLGKFWQDFEMKSDVFWKFERRQHFREPGNPSWEAFNRGDWTRALDYAEETRKTSEAHYRRISERGLDARRIRVVEATISPYLQWEMHVLKIRAEVGERTRVIDSTKLAGLEVHARLPEVVVLGEHALYEVLYDADGVLSGARRSTESDLITAIRGQLDVIYGKAEDLAGYFQRRIADLPPPNQGTSS